MGGLALGSWLASKYARKIRRPIWVYGILELVISITALLVPVLLTLAQWGLIALLGGQPEPVADNGLVQSTYYLIVTFLILAVPTAAMGATLPLLARYAVSEDSQIGPRIGLLYGLNTIGAVAGVLIAGFLLLPYLGLTGTLLVGAVINFIIFIIAVLVSRKAPMLNGQRVDVSDITAFHWVFPLMLLLGVVSFTLEVFWTRLLSHVFGGTVYAFSIMLAAFLTGIAVGGLLAGRVAVTKERAAKLLIIVVSGIAGVSVVSYLLIDLWVPVFSGLSVKSAYAFLIILPSAFFIGATYPLAVRVATDRASETALISGRVYAWNTVGAIIGAILAGFLILPGLGFAGTLRFVCIMCAAISVIAVLKISPSIRLRAHYLAIAIAFGLFAVPFDRPDNMINAYLKKDIEWGQERYYGVGRSATVLMRDAQGFINLSSNGLSESSLGRQGMPPFNLSQKWLAGLPALARPEADSALIIGYGGGVAIEGVPPTITDIDVIEIEPLVLDANRAVAEERGIDPQSDQRVSVFVNDARNAMLLSGKTYDIIVSQPSHPWTGGASHLYTSEFIQLSKSRLNEGGVFLQWINSQFVTDDLLKILTATLADEFSNVELYQPERQVLMFLASDDPIDLWTGANNAEIGFDSNRTHFQRMGMRATEDIIAMSLLDDAGVRAFSNGAPLNTDSKNYLAFFSRASADGLNAEDLASLLKDLDPLTNPNSQFHGGSSDWDRPYIAEQLLQNNFTRRAFQLGRAERDNSVQATIDGLGHYHSNDNEKAEAAFNRAISLKPGNQAAEFGLLRMYLGDLAQRRLPPDIAKLANQQTGVQRRVLEGWVHGASGNFERLKELDQELAEISPTSLAYPIAVKLRVDWRVVFARATGDVEIAKEGLSILDDVLASYWNLDLYVLRAGVADLAGNSVAVVESTATVARQIEAKVNAAKRGGSHIDSFEAELLRSRLNGLRGRVIRLRDETSSPRLMEVVAEVDAVLGQL